MYSGKLIKVMPFSRMAFLASVGYVICSIACNSLYAWELNGTPPSNQSGVLKSPVDVTQPNKEEGIAIDQRQSGPAKVRIGLRLTPFRKVVYATKNGQTLTKYRPDPMLARTLRARINKVNHFFFDEFHVETKPLNWSKEKKILKMRLKINRVYGPYGKVEEKLGHIDITGRLTGQDGLYVLEGVGRGRFVDKRKNPVVDVVAGYMAKSSGLAQKSRGGSGVNKFPENYVSPIGTDSYQGNHSNKPLVAPISKVPYSAKKNENGGDVQVDPKIPNSMNKGKIHHKQKTNIKPTVRTHKNEWQPM
ncbi:MAG: hypothetical protein R3B45_11850 [Bdellovibrionota bacterium]